MASVDHTYSTKLLLKDEELMNAIRSFVPSKDEAYSMLMGLMKAPIEKTVRLLNEVPTKFVRLSNAMKDKQEEVS